MNSKNFKSEDGNGPTPSSKESVPVREEDTQPLFQEPPSSSLEDIITQEKHKDMPILMTPIFLM